MQNDPLSHGLWEMTAPPAPPTAPLKGEVRADVAVVGCGYTGLSAALHLAEAGAKVVALEAVEIGFGGAGRNVGLVNAGMWLAPDDITERLGADYGERLLSLLGGGPAEVYALVDKHGIDCELVRNGTLHCAVGRSGLAKIEERARQWGKRGAPVRVLTQAETAKRIGVDIYAGSLLDLRAGTIQPLAYARGLASAAIAAGAAIHTRSPVRSAERTGKPWTLVTDGGTVTADWIAVATDAYGVASMAAGAARASMRALFQFRHPAFERRAAGLHPARPRGLLGHKDDHEFLPLRSRRAASVRQHRRAARNRTRCSSRLGMRALKKTFPRIGEVAFEAQWYGMMGMTDNALPRFHRLAPNVVTFCGYNGRGIGTGTVFGRVLADHILGKLSEKDLPLPVTEPDAPALPALKEAYYEAGAQIAHAVGAWL